MRRSRYWTLPARLAINRAWFEALQLKSAKVSPDHLLLGILLTDGKAREPVKSRLPNLEAELRNSILSRAKKNFGFRTEPQFFQYLEHARRIARRQHAVAIGTVHLLAAFSKCESALVGEQLKPLFKLPDAFDLSGELASGELISNTRWQVQYKCPDGSVYHLSKFGIGEATMGFDSLKRLWPRWDQGTRSQFALEFNTIGNWLRGPEERAIAKFIADNAEGSVRVNASGFLQRIPTAQAYARIRKWLAETEQAKSNLYQLLQARKYRELGVVSFLESELKNHLAHKNRWSRVGTDEPDRELLNAVSCVQALWHHQRSPRNRRLLLEFSRHRNRFASTWAKSTLKETVGHGG